MSLTIGPHTLKNNVLLAPMAGVTDRPFRQLCRQLGAGLAVSEMVTSDQRLWHTRKTQFRLNHHGEDAPRSVQIAGGDPDMLAEAAQINVANGAEIIDINMGCPAKKVCNKAAGSALLKDEKLVGEILQNVTQAVEVPVTLKIRTGWNPDNRNGPTIARMAEDAGIQLLTVHGRTRACAYKGEAEYDTISQIVNAVNIPVIANGDITTPEKARQVLDYTGASGIMLGRAAQGRPWIFREINHFLKTGELLSKTPLSEISQIMLSHLKELHHFYGEYLGVRIARKHFGWYIQHQPESQAIRRTFNQLESCEEQLVAAREYFEQLIKGGIEAT